jgi:hypothetical protein
MAESPTIPKEIVIQTSFDKDYRLVATNGVWISSTTRQDICIDFFVEQISAPESVTYELEENGRFEKELKRSPEKMQFVRVFQVGVLMSPAQAEAAANGILKRLEAIRKAEGKS